LKFKILKKVTFVVLFVPGHAVVTALMLQRLFTSNAAAGLWPQLANALALLLAMPALFPLIWFDPDGDRLPRWFQAVSFPLNSLVWALMLLLSRAARGRFWTGLALAVFGLEIFMITAVLEPQAFGLAGRILLCAVSMALCGIGGQMIIEARRHTRRKDG
jgi:hypothetical protein